jgi:hypothetical protein
VKDLSPQSNSDSSLITSEEDMVLESEPQLQQELSSLLLLLGIPVTLFES